MTRRSGSMRLWVGLALIAILLGAGTAALAQEDVLPPENQIPVAQCHDATIVADDIGCCGWLDVDEIDAGSYDPDGFGDVDHICIVEVDGMGVGCESTVRLCGLGTHDVTLEIMDYSGASDRCTAFVTLENDPPVALCQYFEEHVNPGGYIQVEIWDIDDGSYDPEGYAADLEIVAVDGAPVGPSYSVDVYGVGMHTVTLEVTDECGQTDQCDADVNVQNAPPYVECHDWTYDYPDQDGCVYVYISDLVSTADDPDGYMDIDEVCIVEVDGSPVGCVQDLQVCGVGDHEVMIVITDMVGAADTCTCTVTIENEPPVAHCRNIEFWADYECCFNVDAYDIDDGSYDPEGYVQDLCIVRVDDVPVDCESLVEVCGAGDHYLWLKITDQLGLTDSCEAIVRINKEPLNVSCRSFSQSGYDCCIDVDLTDIYDGSTMGIDSLNIVAVDGDPVMPTAYVQVCGQGHHSVTVRAVDVCGESGECDADVEVINYAPEARCRPISEDGGTDCCLTVDIWDIDDGSYDDDGNIDSLYISELDGMPMNAETVEVCGAGDHSIALTVVDRCGERDECHTTVTIENEPPMAYCRTYEADADDDCCIWVTTSDIDDGSYDPDGSGDIRSMVITELDGAAVDSLTGMEVCGQGEHAMELTVTDWCGESSSCMATVIVRNQPPVALCKYHEDEADENCCITVTVADVDGGSYDPDGDGQINDICIIGLDGDPVMCEHEIEVCGAMDPHTVSLEITDNCGSADTCEATVVVVDVTPPEIDVALDRYVLWPPNHKMVDIASSIEVWDNCDPNPAIELVSITSSEPDDTLGDGHHEPDIQGADFGTPDSTFSLRAERMGLKLGRIYTIVYTATDFSGNSTTATVYVRVPHNQPGMAFAAHGFNEDGSGFIDGSEDFVLVIPSQRAVYGINEAGKTFVAEQNFDATELEVSATRVGNTNGVAIPVESWTLDANDDGRMDLAVRYLVTEARPLAEDILEGQFGEIWITEDINPVGLHYRSARGVDYLVYDIFQLGAPLGQSGGASGVGDDGIEHVTAMYPVQPNPFSSLTNMRFSLAREERVTLSIYDARGLLVRALEDKVLPGGMHQATWDGRDAAGRPVAAGVYFARFSAGACNTTQKVMLLK